MFEAKSHRYMCSSGLHKLWYPGIRDMSTWSKFGAHGEHGDVFLFSNLGALWFSENRALVLGEFDIWIKIFIVCLFKGSQKQSFFLQTLLFTAFLVTVLKMLTYALVSTWSLVSSGYEHVKQLMQPWWGVYRSDWLARSLPRNIGFEANPTLDSDND